MKHYTTPDKLVRMLPAWAFEAVNHSIYLDKNKSLLEYFLGRVLSKCFE